MGYDLLNIREKQKNSMLSTYTAKYGFADIFTLYKK